VVERAVNTGNDFEGKRPELIVLSSETTAQPVEDQALSVKVTG